MFDEPLTHRGVAFGGVGVVADDEPLRARPVGGATAGCDPDLLDPQVVGHVVVAAGAGQRGGGLGVGVAQLLGVDVVPAAAGEIGAVGGGGEAGVGHPHQPVQVPGPQVVLDRADDPLVALAAGKGPAAHRDSVAGDRHRDHHLGPVVAMVLGLAEPASAVLDRLAGAVVGLRFGLQVGQLVRHVDVPVGGGGVDENDVDVQVEQVRDRVEDRARRSRPARRAGSPSPDTPRRRRTRRSRRSRPARPPTVWRPACCPAPVPAAPPARTAPARSHPRPGAGPRRPGAAPRRHPAARQSWSSSHAPPKRRESTISIWPVCAAAIACSGSRNREIETTSRASASRSTASARPKLWITLAEGTPVTGWRSLCASCRYDTVDPSRLRRFVSRRYTPTPIAHIRW